MGALGSGLDWGVRGVGPKEVRGGGLRLGVSRAQPFVVIISAEPAGSTPNATVQGFVPLVLQRNGVVDMNGSLTRMNLKKRQAN